MNFLCADTEDDSVECMKRGDGFAKKVTQIAAKTAEGKTFYNNGNVREFLKWLHQVRKKFVYFHNLQYDLGNLFPNDLDALDVTMVGGRMIKAVWGEITFVDSFNMWPMKVASIGEAFGIKKLETSDMANDKDYVFRDVEIIRQAMLFAWQFALENGIENLPATLGGLCVKLWKAWGGVNQHDSSELSREALYGGRVELFKTGNDTSNVAYTDINSLYPFIMCGYFPEVMEEQGKKLPIYGIAEVTITAPKIELPVLPYRDEDGRILYPVGKFRGTWTVAEIRAAEARGYQIQRIHRASGCDTAVKPYEDFVRRNYKARLAAKTDAEKLFYKLLMNNLYGRLGTTGLIGRSVIQTDKNKYDGVPYGEKVLVKYHMPLSEETNWSHAAYVTGNGRLELLKYMELIGAANMIYADTDSTIFDCEKIPFPVGKELGEMKLEGMLNTCRTYAPKQYQADDTFKAKGVPKRLAKEYIETGKAQFDLPFKFREAIKFFDRDNAKQLSVWRTVEKFNHASYDRKKLIGNRFFPCKKS